MFLFEEKKRGIPDREAVAGERQGVDSGLVLRVTLHPLALGYSTSSASRLSTQVCRRNCPVTSSSKPAKGDIHHEIVIKLLVNPGFHTTQREPGVRTPPDKTSILLSSLISPDGYIAGIPSVGAATCLDNKNRSQIEEQRTLVRG